MRDLDVAGRRIFCGVLSAETNVFSPIPTDLASFQRHLYVPAHSLDPAGEAAWPEPLEAFRQYSRQAGWTLVQGLCAAAAPAGPLPRTAYETLRDRLLDDLREALPVDVVVLALHGGMIAEGYDDCEGDILARARRIVGPSAPLGAVLDPHAHLTPQMVESVTAMVFFKEYPHTDVFDSAAEIIHLLSAVADGTVEPVASVFDCRMISFYFTDREPMRGFVEAMRDMERQPGVLSVSLVHGFPWGDTPWMGTRVIVYTDNRCDLGDRLARDLGERLFSLRGQTLPLTPTIGNLIDALATPRGAPVVLADIADNPGGGAPGDSTFIARALLDAGVPDVAVGPLWDPEAVQQAMARGVGAKSRLPVGGKASRFSGQPLDLEFEVVSIVKDARQVIEGWPWRLGDTALLRHAGLEIVVATERDQCLSLDVFENHGIEVARKNVVVVKSAQHFTAAFAPLAAEIHYVDTPGALFLGADPSRYRHISRPMWPFDDDPFPSPAASDAAFQSNPASECSEAPTGQGGPSK